MLHATVTVPLSAHTARVSLTKSAIAVTATPTKSLHPTVTRRRVSTTQTFVLPPTPFQYVTESQILGFITLAVTTVSSIVTGYPTVILTQFIAVVGQSQAAGDNAHQRTEPMAHIVSPLWSFGSTAIAAGNTVIICAVIVIHAFVTKYAVLGGGETAVGEGDASTKKRGDSVAPGGPVQLPTTWVVHHFPEVSHVIALTFYQGLVNAAFNIFYHEDGPVFVIGTVCLLLTVALPLLLYWLLYRFLAGGWPAYRDVVYTHPFGWAFPHGYWSAGRVKRCFGRIFASTTDKGIRFVGYPLLLVLLVNAAANVKATDKQQRDAQFGVLGLLFLVTALFIGVFRPHRSHVTNVVYIVAFLLLLVLCVCLANEATNAGAADGVPVVIIVFEVLLWANGVYEIIVWFAEMRGVLHAARKAHMQGDESGAMRTRTKGARADAKKAAAARTAFAEGGHALDSSEPRHDDESDDERRVPPITAPPSTAFFGDDPVTPSGSGSPYYVEMGRIMRQEDPVAPASVSAFYEPPAAHVPAPGKVEPLPHATVEATPLPPPVTVSAQATVRQEEPAPPVVAREKVTVTPPPPPSPDVQDDFLDMFAKEDSSPRPAAASKPPPSFGLLQRANDEALVSKSSVAKPAGAPAKKMPPTTNKGKSASKKKAQGKGGKRGSGGGSSSSSDDIFGSDTDDSDL